MKLPDSVKRLREKLFQKFPLALNELASSEKEEKFRKWCIRFAEQVAFSLDDSRWGVKSASSTRPISKDTIAFKDGATILIWDLFSGVSSDRTTPNLDPESLDVSDQFFIPVTPTNHLASEPVPNPDPNPDPESGNQLDALFNAIAELQSQVAAMHRDLGKFSAALANFSAPVEFKIFGKTVKGWVGKKPA